MQKRKGLAEKEGKMGTVKKAIILHGWTYSSGGNDPLEKWQPFIKLLGSHGIKCELPQIPGITNDMNQQWNLEKYIDWLKKKVGSEKVILIGHSNGGRIGLAFAEKYPEKIAKLILIDSAGIYHNELPIRLKRFIFRNIAKIGRRISDSESLRKLIYKVAREGDYSSATPAQRKTMINLINTDLSKILKEIKVPTLIIWGENDRVTPLNDAKLMHSLIKKSKLKIISSAKHSPQFTHLKEVAKIIYEYL